MAYSTYRKTRRPRGQLRSILNKYRPNRSRYNKPVSSRQINYISQRILIKKGVDTVFSQGAVAPNFDTDDIVTNMANSDFVFPVNLIQAGSSSWTRVNRKVNMKSLRLYGQLYVDWGDLDVQDTTQRPVRVLIVQDKQPNGQLPTKTDILAAKNQSGIEAGAFNALLSYDNMARFKILRDEQIFLEPCASNTSLSVKNLDVYLKLPITCTYQAESSPAVIGDISTNAIYVVFLTDVSTADSGRNLYFDGQARLRFTD